MDAYSVDVCVVVIHQNDIAPGLDRYLTNCRSQGVQVITHQGQNDSTHPNPFYRKFLNCSASRNEAKQIALAHSTAQKFLFLDSDIVPPAHTIPALISAGCPVAGGWYQQKHPLQIQISEGNRIRIELVQPWVAGRWVEEDRLQLFYYPRFRQIYSHVVPLGCVMINRDLVEQIDFQPGIDQVCKSADYGFEMIVGECFAYGVALLQKNIVARLIPNVICEHVPRKTNPAKINDRNQPEAQNHAHQDFRTVAADFRGHHEPISA